MSAIVLPRPVTPIERSLIKTAETYVTFLRDNMKGTGTVLLRLDVKDGLILGLRGGVEGPTERFRADQ
jgi:hypothetical protein